MSLVPDEVHNSAIAKIQAKTEQIGRTTDMLYGEGGMFGPEWAESFCHPYCE